MRHERGFSLVELMVAMTVTLIVSGAIFGLLTSGGNAFRREPEVADRQQNIRTAMDLISRDVFNAGAALPTFAQAFTRIDPAGGDCVAGLNGCGVAGMMGATAASARGAGDTEATDVLEIISTDERCPTLTECCKAATCLPNTPIPGAAGDFVTREAIPQCMTLPGLALLTTVTGNPATDWFVIQPATATTASPSDCVPGGDTRNGNLTLGAALAAWPATNIASPPFVNDPPPAAPVVFVYRGRIVRYRIAPSLDPLEAGIPVLWRSESGRYTTGGLAVTEPGLSGFPGANSPWELVARGIEDLQVEYQAAGAWDNQPPVAITGTWTTLVRRVRITLSARAALPNLQGATTAAGGAPNAVRGQLSTVVTPRAAFEELQMGNQIK